MILRVDHEKLLDGFHDVVVVRDRSHYESSDHREIPVEASNCRQDIKDAQGLPAEVHNCVFELKFDFKQLLPLHTVCEFYESLLAAHVVFAGLVEELEN